MSLQEKFDVLRRKNALAMEGGGKKRIETQHDEPRRKQLQRSASSLTGTRPRAESSPSNASAGPGS